MEKEKMQILKQIREKLLVYKKNKNKKNGRNLLNINKIEKNI